MFYNFVMKFVQILIRIFNGKTEVLGKENLPEDEKFLLVAPHRSYLDPVFIAISAFPHTFAFMGKKELFDIPIFGKIARKLNGFPVDRKNPGISAVRTPVNYLRRDELNVLIFPTGSRHSSKIKGGAITIAKFANRKIVPAVYIGPLTLKDVFLRKKAVVRFGEPFEIDEELEGVTDINSYYSDFIQDAFDELEK